MKFVQATVFFAFSALFGSQIAALEFDTIRYNALLIITATGAIESGDADRFKGFWEENAYDAFTIKVALDSPGARHAWPRTMLEGKSRLSSVVARRSGFCVRFGPVRSITFPSWSAKQRSGLTACVKWRCGCRSGVPPLQSL